LTELSECVQHHDLWALFVVSSPLNVVRVIKSRGKRRARTCGMYGKQERCIQFWWRDPREGDNLEYIDIDGVTVLKCIGVEKHGLD
jgi:hypothetical protein